MSFQVIFAGDLVFEDGWQEHRQSNSLKDDGIHPIAEVHSQHESSAGRIDLKSDVIPVKCVR